MCGKPSAATHAEDPEQAIMLEIGACPLSEQFQAIREHDSVAWNQNVANTGQINTTTMLRCKISNWFRLAKVSKQQ